ncbi:MAG: phosphoglucosamine mutase [Gammaproteobacteria bacterium]|nr:phosphoglucosamine mutase [Gammaproteobacteria bacterium]
MRRHYFGTDGIRGRVGEEPISPETILKLGWAAGRVLLGSERGSVLIGKDTRVSGYLLESALEAGLAAAGADIRLIGPIPTPGIAYLTRTTRAQAGIVISASHNPYEDNGIKFFSSQGTKLPDDIELAIEDMMARPLRAVESSALGKVRRFPDAAGRYIEFCKSAFPYRLDLDGLRIVVDCAHGATYQTAPHVFGELGADVIPIGVAPDGFNINRACGSTCPETVRDAVLEHRADLGVALDGDGDRVIMVDHRGEIIDGDRILFIIASHRQRMGQIVSGVVGTLMSNVGLEQALKRLAIPFRRAAVGDRHVMAVLNETGWQLGGEASGHVICLDKSTTGDGTIAALQVLWAMRESNSSLANLAAGIEVYPQTIINVSLRRGLAAGDVIRSPSVQAALHEVEQNLGEQGRVVLRASGTEPVVRVMVEAADPAMVVELSRHLAKAVEQAAATAVA